MLSLLAMSFPVAGARAAPARLDSVIVTLRHPAGAPPAGATAGEVVRRLRDTAATTQAPVRRLLARRRAEGLVWSSTPLWIDDSIAVTAAPRVVAELERRTDVAAVRRDAVIHALGAPPAPNLTRIGIPELWNAGMTGAGAVVASLDTGVDIGHPELAATFRGGASDWFDPYGQHATPTDQAGTVETGHGTWTTGLMVAGSASGTSLGVAPGARWIAAKVFDDRGDTTDSAIHRAFQWVLDPDGDPATADAPDVVLGAWGSEGCDLRFGPDVSALRAAGILPVFAAGNFGPGSATAAWPADYPDAIAVGATDAGDAVTGYSSRGPSLCGATPKAVFPDVVAPGDLVQTTDLFGLYATVSGTSFAAPHVAGALALLRSAHSDRTPEEILSALESTATDLGATGPDDEYGRGRIDVPAASAALGAPSPRAVPPPAAPPQPTPAPPAPQAIPVPAGATVDVPDPPPDVPPRVISLILSPRRTAGRIRSRVDVVAIAEGAVAGVRAAIEIDGSAVGWMTGIAGTRRLSGRIPGPVLARFRQGRHQIAVRLADGGSGGALVVDRTGPRVVSARRRPGSPRLALRMVDPATGAERGRVKVVTWRVAGRGPLHAVRPVGRGAGTVVVRVPRWVRRARLLVAATDDVGNRGPWVAVAPGR